MRGGEPCVPDRLEDRTPISCEWAEKEHTGRRAEPKAEGYAPELAFSKRGSRGNAAARSNTACRMAFLSPFLFLSPSTSSSSARFRMRSWSARPNSVSRRRLPVSAFTLSPHQPPSRSFRIESGLRPPAFRLPREGRQLPGSRGAFHRLESTCTGLAPSAFIDRSSDHVDALLIGYPFP